MNTETNKLDFRMNYISVWLLSVIRLEIFSLLCHKVLIYLSPNKYRTLKDLSVSSIIGVSIFKVVICVEMQALLYTVHPRLHYINYGMAEGNSFWWVLFVNTNFLNAQILKLIHKVQNWYKSMAYTHNGLRFYVCYHGRVSQRELAHLSRCKAAGLFLCSHTGLVWSCLLTTRLTAVVTHVRSPFKISRNRGRERGREEGREQPTVVSLLWDCATTPTHLKINRQFYGVLSSSKHDWAFILCFSTKHNKPKSNK